MGFIKRIIKRIRLHSLDNEHHHEFNQSVVQIVSDRPVSVIEMLGMVKWKQPYFESFAKEKIVYDFSRKSSITRKLVETDKLRDTTHRNFYRVVKGLLFHTKPEVKDAAQRVMDVFTTFGSVPRRKYNAESSAIEGMLREFEKAPYSADITTLNVTDLRDHLKAYNDEFRQLTRTRDMELNERPDYRMKDIRKEVDKSYNQMITHLEYLVMDGKTSPALTELITELDTLITRYNNIIARSKRRSRKNSDNGNESSENNSENTET